MKSEINLLYKYEILKYFKFGKQFETFGFTQKYNESLLDKGRGPNSTFFASAIL